MLGRGKETRSRCQIEWTFVRRKEGTAFIFKEKRRGERKRIARRWGQGSAPLTKKKIKLKGGEDFRKSLPGWLEWIDLERGKVHRYQGFPTPG